MERDVLDAVPIGGAVRCVLEHAGRVSLSFGLTESVLLDDGTRLLLHDDRGWTQGRNVGDTWAHLTLDHLKSSIRTVLLPDDLGEDSYDDHHWLWLVDLCAAHGVITDRETLRALPYALELDEQLEARFGLSSIPMSWTG